MEGRPEVDVWIICRTVVNLQYIVPLHQTTANIHPAVGDLRHLVTIDATRMKIGGQRHID